MINTYLQQLNEAQLVKGTKTSENLEGSDKAKIKPLAVKDIEGINDVEEPEELQGLSTEQTNNLVNKKEKGDNINNMSTPDNNAFERLYRQAINEDFDDEMNSDLENNVDGADLEDSDFDSAESQDIDNNPAHIGKVKEVITLLQQALDHLSAFEGEEEQETGEEDYEEYSDDEDSDLDSLEGDDEEAGHPFKEEADVEVHGHALADGREKLMKGLNKPGNMVVKGAVPAAGKKATPHSKMKADGKLTNFSNSGSKKMQGKGNMQVSDARRQNTPNKFAFED